MHARWLSFVVWALLAASLAYWSLMLMARGPQAPAQTRPALTDAAPADWSRLFASPNQPATPTESADAQFQLLGVVAPKAGARHPGEGVALIAVSGAPAKPVRIGQVVEGDLQLIEVNSRDVGLGQNGNVSVRLNLTPGAPGAPGAALSPPPAMVPGQDAGMLPPNYGQQPYVPTGAGRRNSMVIPTAINPRLPQSSENADGSADPRK